MASDYAPRKWRRRSSPRCVLPFRFGQKTVMVAGPITQPACIVLRVVPGHANGRMAVVLREAQVSPGCRRIQFIDRGTGQAAPGTAVTCPDLLCRNEGGPLSTRNVELACGKLTDMHLTLRT